MPYRKLTGQISHRHPFHGGSFGSYYHVPDMYDFDVASIDRRYAQVQGFGQEELRQELPAPPIATAPSTGKKVIGAIVMAGIGGAGAYFIARMLERGDKQAMQWGSIAAVVFAIGSLLGEPKEKKA